MDKHIHWMRRTLLEAESGLAEGELPIAALVVAGDEEVVRARAGDVGTGNRSNHAEILAIVNTPLNRFRATGLSLYTTLEPCVMCAAAILIEGFSTVVYALPAPQDGGCFIFDDPLIRSRCFSAARPEVLAGVCRDEARELFQRYIDLYPERSGLVGFAGSIVSQPV